MMTGKRQETGIRTHVSEVISGMQLVVSWTNATNVRQLSNWRLLWDLLLGADTPSGEIGVSGEEGPR